MDISNLIKEAKPLYFKRKRRRRIIKSVGVCLASCLILGVFISQPTHYVNTHQDFYAYLYDDESYEQDLLLLAQIDLKLPLDEYIEMELS